MENKGSGEDTIAAIATPIGQAGIGIVRISGDKAKDVARRVFRPKTPTQDFESHRLYLGHFIDPATGESIDEVLLTYMKSPRSYTREDVIEINSHSGHFLLAKILQVLLGEGIRLARPGEFTFRAFMNGRIDLTQAEGVVDLINSRSERGLQLAAEQIKGALRKTIEELRQRALDMLAHLEAAIDFPEEDFATLHKEPTISQMEEDLVSPIERIIASHDQRKLWLEGVRLVIVGRVNVGKSSLLNRLLNEERAIVTPYPGTTRDVIESTIHIHGLPFRIADTAGIRKARGEIEKIGVHLAQEEMAKADLSLLVIDQSRPLNQEDIRIIRQANRDKCILVINKIDLSPRLDETKLTPLAECRPIVRISALTGAGISQLKEKIKEATLAGTVDGGTSPFVPNLRHKQVLLEASNAFKRAVASIREDLPYEVTAMELHSGLDALGEVTGETTSEEILDRIFSQFCLGK